VLGKERTGIKSLNEALAITIVVYKNLTLLGGEGEMRVQRVKNVGKNGKERQRKYTQR
jgi:hypothetical protein